MPVYQPIVNRDVLMHICRAEEMHNFVLTNVPECLLLDTDEKTILVALFSLAVEHHGAILHLLKSGHFDGSAMALARPLIDCAYRALWLHFSGKPEHFASVMDGGSPYPGLPNMAEAIDKKAAATDGLFLVLKPFITALHGYTHGGLEQLGRRFDGEGNIRATFTDSERLELVNASTAYLVMFAIAWCQIYAGGDPAAEPRSAAITQRYNESYGPPAECKNGASLQPTHSPMKNLLDSMANIEPPPKPKSDVIYGVLAIVLYPSWGLVSSALLLDNHIVRGKLLQAFTGIVFAGLLPLALHIFEVAIGKTYFEWRVVLVAISFGGILTIFFGSILQAVLLWLGLHNVLGLRIDNWYWVFPQNFD